MHQPIEDKNQELFEFYTQWLGQLVHVHDKSELALGWKGRILCVTPDVITVLLEDATQPLNYSMKTLEELDCKDGQPSVISEAPQGVLKH